MVMVVVDPIGWSRFFIGATVDPAGRPGFGAVVGWAVSLGGTDGLAISGAILTGREIVIGFSGLSL